MVSVAIFTLKISVNKCVSIYKKIAKDTKLIATI